MITGLLTRQAPCHASLLQHHDVDADSRRAAWERLSELASSFWPGLGQHAGLRVLSKFDLRLWHRASSS